MKRTRTIAVNGRSELNLTVTFTVDSDRELCKDETETLVEAITDQLYRACMADKPFHTVHASDVKIKP